MNAVQDLPTRAVRELLGAPHAALVVADTKARLARLTHLNPTMVAVTASSDPATRVYVERKAARARKLGLTFRVDDLGADVSQAALHAHLRQLADDADVHGVVLELPLAAHLDADRALEHLSPAQDVEGLTPANLALIAAGREAEATLPPTPTSCRTLLASALDLDGARVAVIGPGRTVGRPLVWMLGNAGATVTVTTPRTRDLAGVLAGVDGVVVAVGRPCLLEARHLLPHHAVVDAGINVVANVVVGDAAPDVADAVRAMTPVPGGVGPLTSALMFANFADLLERRSEG